MGLRKVSIEVSKCKERISSKLLNCCHLSEVEDDGPEGPEVCDELLGLPAELVPHRVQLRLQLLLEGPPQRALHAQLVVRRQRRVQPLQLLVGFSAVMLNVTRSTFLFQGIKPKSKSRKLKHRMKRLL